MHNRQGLSLGVLLPAEHLSRKFAGDPRQLLGWLVDAPALRPWLRDGRRGAGRRASSYWRRRNMPYLIEDGLAVGGAAAGLGVDFPVLNLIGPATATGTAPEPGGRGHRSQGGDLGREALVRHYLEPLRRTRYWHDGSSLSAGPVIRRTHVLFDRGIDLFLDPAAVWGAAPLATVETTWLVGRARPSLLVGVGRAGRRVDAPGPGVTFAEVAARPALSRMLLDGALNAFGDLVGRPRPHLPPPAACECTWTLPGGRRARGAPLLVRRWFARLRPVLASAGRQLYANDDTPLSAKRAGLSSYLCDRSTSSTSSPPPDSPSGPP